MLRVVGDVAKQRFPLSNIQCALLILLGVAAVISVPGSARGVAISAVVPYEVLASGFEEISGLTVEPDGAVLVTDRRAGTLMRVSAGGTRQVVLANLQTPHGVAVASTGGVFVLEDRTRVLRLDRSGVLSLVAASLSDARAIAAGPDGRVWVATRQSGRPDFQIGWLEASGAIRVIAAGFVDLRALAVNEVGIHVAVESLAGEQQSRTRLARLRWRQDGSVGPVESLIRNTLTGPSGVASDAAGDVFIAGTLQPSQPGSGAVLKRRSAGTMSTVVSGLSLPGAAAFGPTRDLFLVESSSRILRFRSPARPDAQVPLFTNRTPLRVTGRAQAGSLIQVFGASGSVLASGPAHATTGAFAVNVPLALNQHNRVSVVATTSGGGGLVGLPMTASTLHDDHLPVVQMLEPSSAVHVTDAVVGRARAEDQGSGMATLGFKVDQFPQATVQTAKDGQPVTAATLIQTARFSEGPHTLTAVAIDRAGNQAAATQLVVVDRTPPDTVIQSRPPAEVADRRAVFELGGFDAQSAELDFSWRFDAGPWSAFSPSNLVSLAQLSDGSHRLEAAARDQAGNVDPTPATQAFTVTAARVRIMEPVSAANISTATTWIRGVVAGDDVSLRIPLPPLLQSELGIAALPVPHEAGTFAAEIPVVPAMASVTVIARDVAGVESADTVAMTVVEPVTQPLRLEGHPAAGFAPHTARFPVSGFPAGSVYSIDLEGDGTAEYTGNALADREFVFARPGIHVPTLTVRVPDGRALVARGAIEVYDRAALEARLRTRWSGFKAALRAGDIAAASVFVHADRRAAWAEHLGRLTPAQLAATDVTLREITLVDVMPGRAECQMVREEGGVSYSFPVSFEIDADRGWGLWQF